MGNTELPLPYAKQLDAMYPTVERDEDDDLEDLDEDGLEDEDDDMKEPDEDELADLAEGMGSLKV
jgi:hypothetical protein